MNSKTLCHSFSAYTHNTSDTRCVNFPHHVLLIPSGVSIRPHKLRSQPTRLSPTQNILKGTHGKPEEEMYRVKSGSSPAQELLSLWTWGVPPFQYMDVFITLKALQTPYFGDFY